MGAKLLKYHCENADSPIYKNLMSQPSVLAVGSGCTGTVRFEECVGIVHETLAKVFCDRDNSETWLPLRHS